MKKNADIISVLVPITIAKIHLRAMEYEELSAIRKQILHTASLEGSIEDLFIVTGIPQNLIERQIEILVSEKMIQMHSNYLKLDTGGVQAWSRLQKVDKVIDQAPELVLDAFRCCPTVVSGSKPLHENRYSKKFPRFLHQVMLQNPNPNFVVDVLVNQFDIDRKEFEEGNIEATLIRINDEWILERMPLDLFRLPWRCFNLCTGEVESCYSSEDSQLDSAESRKLLTKRVIKKVAINKIIKGEGEANLTLLLDCACGRIYQEADLKDEQTVTSTGYFELRDSWNEDRIKSTISEFEKMILNYYYKNNDHIIARINKINIEESFTFIIPISVDRLHIGNKHD